MRMTSLSASSTKPTRGASGTRCDRGWKSSRLSCIRTRRGCWSSAAMQRSTARAGVLADRRPSPFWVSSSSAASLVVVLSSYSGRPEGIACGRNSGRSRRRCGRACMNRFQCKGNGSGRWCADTLRIMRCLPTRGHSSHFEIMSPIYGGARSGGVVRRTP